MENVEKKILEHFIKNIIVSIKPVSSGFQVQMRIGNYVMMSLVSKDVFKKKGGWCEQSEKYLSEEFLALLLKDLKNKKNE